ncbi:hypothetical protein [Xanthocytophaga agilis]|uniref:Uncharacterized protein n=1 Tax=Xanthocytophaga agilis TaxID=3048010 RepID=A0AAE3RCU0_9BACT|nr:hypothetical protein [Xanthocytophaga agilis]MDJ1506079.1 hypothetical protein [Xanthocytophaga agilis]
MRFGTKVLIVICFVLFLGCGYYFGSYYHQNVKRHKQMYCYETFSGPINSALIVDDVSDGKELIAYYKLVEQGKNPIINFRIQGLPTDEPVYIMGYIGEDSSLVDVVNYWNGGGKSRQWYLRGYVYRATLHEQPPRQIKSD